MTEHVTPAEGVRVATRTDQERYVAKEVTTSLSRRPVIARTAMRDDTIEDERETVYRQVGRVRAVADWLEEAQTRAIQRAGGTTEFSPQRHVGAGTRPGSLTGGNLVDGGVVGVQPLPVRRQHFQRAEALSLPTVDQL
ncbi:hypothetical protein [Streptomyces anthocyanicus]|uniref:hypothetical protein n=1 Tax=Streptomyces anthocyanicus TaxID=68174 RepID=UPI003862D578